MQTPAPGSTIGSEYFGPRQPAVITALPTLAMTVVLLMIEILRDLICHNCKNYGGNYSIYIYNIDW